MNIRKTIKKWLYGKCPGFAGSFPYLGTRVFFPKDSLIFHLACEEGIFEIENIGIISRLIAPNTVYFDVGANIGLMAIPILRYCPSCTVVSMEPSPNTIQFLAKTAKKSNYGSRWHIIEKAAGSSVGNIEFHICAAELGALDGLKDTKRAGETNKVSVEITTLDAEWEEMGRPSVSVIKIDVEGAELQVLEGALICIKCERPYIVMEWNRVNLQAYQYPLESLLKFADSIDYQVFSLPYGIHVGNATELEVQMLKTESFLLAPSK